MWKIWTPSCPICYIKLEENQLISKNELIYTKTFFFLFWDATEKEKMSVSQLGQLNRS